jgi:hypothetical protein
VNFRSFKEDWVRRLPAEWRTTYSWIKDYVLSPRTGSAPKPLSLSEEFAANRITVLTSCFAIVAAVTLRTLLPPELSLAPLFIFGCIFPTLVISRRWGTMAAIACTVALSVTEVVFKHVPFPSGLFLWNTTMRFLFFEFYVFLFGCMRHLAQDPSRGDKSTLTSPPV